MAKNRLARRRKRYTHQAHAHALESIRRDGRTCGAIPVAVGPQAFLEAHALERIGEWNPACWHHDILGFGITWVDPSPTSIALGIPTRFLPDIISALIPMSSPDELADSADDGYVEVYGLPGLRYRTVGCTAILSVPGIPGRIEIPVASPEIWEKAVLIAKASWDEGSVFFWDECPTDWHTAERAFTETWPRRYGIGNSYYRTSRLASDVLRRLPAICAPFAAHDMWFNSCSEDGYAIEFEWQNSGPPRKILDLLLDRKDGLRVQLKTCWDEQPISHFYSDDCTYVDLVSDLGGRLDLRHLRYPQRLSNNTRPTVFDVVRQHRLELERQYGYPSSEKFLSSSAM
ncbi:hypothetical protein [Nocardiopsis sp. CNT312]|uniref:hypothetical protein n=1 Tax=Nocardiopsis sp. CNT312 TaxID=1137268 RepID=UPI00048BD760|nr:hypothetical protein [Nocardiopsis sp. CNT312]